MHGPSARMGYPSVFFWVRFPSALLPGPCLSCRQLLSPAPLLSILSRQFHLPPPLNHFEVSVCSLVKEGFCQSPAAWTSIQPLQRVSQPCLRAGGDIICRRLL